MLSMMSRSRWVPTSRTSWPLSASGKLSAVAMMPDPRTLTVVIVFPPRSQNKVQSRSNVKIPCESPQNGGIPIDFGTFFETDQTQRHYQAGSGESELVTDFSARLPMFVFNLR